MTPEQARALYLDHCTVGGLEQYGEKAAVAAIMVLAERYEAAASALVELVEVARLRGDNDLPHPSDDPKLWTARMIDAWGEAESAADDVETTL